METTDFYVLKLQFKAEDVETGEMKKQKREFLAECVNYAEAEKLAYDIMEEECRAARPLIKKRIEQIIDEYNFPQLERDEIMYTIADVLTDRLLPEK